MGTVGTIATIPLHQLGKTLYRYTVFYPFSPLQGATVLHTDRSHHLYTDTYHRFATLFYTTACSPVNYVPIMQLFLVSLHTVQVLQADL